MEKNGKMSIISTGGGIIITHENFPKTKIGNVNIVYTQKSAECRIITRIGPVAPLQKRFLSVVGYPLSKFCRGVTPQSGGRSPIRYPYPDICPWSANGGTYQKRPRGIAAQCQYHCHYDVREIIVHGCAKRFKRFFCNPS